jgi:hypothetical protein
MLSFSIMPGATHDLHQDQYGRFNAMAEALFENPFTRPTTEAEIEREVLEQVQP